MKRRISRVFNLSRPQKTVDAAVSSDQALLPPPAAWSRVFIWTLSAGCLGILLWSILTKVEETVILTGEISTEKPGVQVTARDPGIISAVNIKLHQKVEAGDILIIYKDDETEKRLESQFKRRYFVDLQSKEEEVMFSLRRKQIEKRLDLDRDLLNRLKNLLNVGAIQETQVLEKQAEITKAEISLSSLGSEIERSRAQSRQQLEEIDQTIRELQAKIARFTVRSPISGFVQEFRHQTVGERIQSADTISVIVPDQEINARIRIPSKLSAPLEINTAADVDIDAFPAADFGSIDAVISSISPTTSQISNQSSDKTYEAELELLQAQNPDQLSIADLRPGMAITARIRLREKPVIATVFSFLDGLFDPLNQQR